MERGEPQHSSTAGTELCHVECYKRERERERERATGKRRRRRTADEPVVVGVALTKHILEELVFRGLYLPRVAQLSPSQIGEAGDRSEHVARDALPASPHHSKRQLPHWLRAPVREPQVLPVPAEQRPVQGRGSGREICASMLHTEYLPRRKPGCGSPASRVAFRKIQACRIVLARLCNGRAQWKFALARRAFPDQNVDGHIGRLPVTRCVAKV